MTTHYRNLSSSDRAILAERLRGQPGLTGTGREEHAVYQYDEETRAHVVIISTTRPATVADLLDTGRPILRITEQADYWRVYLPGDEYRPGGVLRCLRRTSTMDDEARAAAGERLRAARAGGAS